MKAVVDENLPPSLARILNGLAEVDGDSVSSVRDLGKNGTKDVELFDHLGSNDFSVHISMDHHYRKPAEREAITRNGLVLFVLAKGWANQSLVKQAAQLILWWPRIVSQATEVKPPAGYIVPWKIQAKFDVIKNIGR